jgi:hypothetical protein
MKLYGKEYVEFGRAIVQNDGTYTAVRDYFTRIDEQWRVLYAPGSLGKVYSSPVIDLTPSKPSCEDLEDHTQNGINMALSTALTFFYEWRVELGYEGYPTLGFVTDAIGAQEVFRLRDLPNGASRRAALRHWVLQHWRHRHDDPEAHVKVRQHLRGTEHFHWNGLTCAIHVSQYDREKNTRLERERTEERRAQRL